MGVNWRGFDEDVNLEPRNGCIVYQTKLLRGRWCTGSFVELSLSCMRS